MRFISPLKILKSKLKHFILNLNQYRNAHYRVLNTCKINYKKYMERQIKSAPKFTKVLCLYKVYFGSKRCWDVGNICSVHEKFFEDALVELGKLPDDNAQYLPLVIYLGCGIDKENPRVEIEVRELTDENVDLTFKEICDIIRVGGKDES